MIEQPDASILIVDDEPANVQLVRALLQQAGYTNLRTTTDSREVAGLYKELEPDLILLDLRMPHLDGFQVMQQLSLIERDNYLPILVLTAETDREVRLRALESGAKDFLIKPLDRVEVLTRISNMLEVRLLQNNLRDQNRILDEKVEARTRELRDTQLEIVQRLGSAAEYRDDETGAHIKRLSLFAVVLGKAVGLDETDIEILENAIPMHDVGKIGIPDSVLLKPGKLDDAEWETMRSHATIGASVLAGSSSYLLISAQAIARSHHEKWDGSGYPSGLVGAEITYLARICAICDVYDALTSDRPYKTAWSTEDAAAEIEKSAGSHFDPDLVQAFSRVADQFAEITRIHNPPVD